jgi:hypothetical protein
MSILEKLKAARAAAMKTEGKTKVKGTMSSEVDGKNYTSKGVVKSKTNSLNNTTKTVTKLKGRGYDNPIQKSRSVVVKNADGTVKRTGGNTKFKKGYEAKPVMSLKTKSAQELPTKKITPTIQIPAPRNEPTMGYTKKMGQTPMQRKLMLAKGKARDIVNKSIPKTEAKYQSEYTDRFYKELTPLTKTKKP